MNENETKPPRTRRIAAVRRHEAAHPDWTPQDQREHFWNTAMQVFGVSTWTEVDERDANDKRWDEICPDNADAIGADGIYHTPPEVLVDAVLGNPPLGGITDTPDEAKPTGGKLIGIANGTNCITAWCVKSGLRVNVTTQRDAKSERVWSMTARVGEKICMMATIFGGRWQANVYTRMVRNALVARCNRVRKVHANQKAKKAACAAAKEA